MKRILIIAAMLMAGSLPAFAQSKDEQAVRQTLNELATSIKAKDYGALNRLWADDYTFVSPEGTMYDNAGHLARLKSRPDFASFGYENVRVRLYGNVAVANATLRMKYVTGDDFTNVVTHTLVKNGGRWQVVAAHATLANQTLTNMP